MASLHAAEAVAGQGTLGRGRGETSGASGSVEDDGRRGRPSARRPVVRGALAGLVALVVMGTLTACGSRTTGPRASALDDDAITIGSFDFAESEVLAQIYGQALEAAGLPGASSSRRGPREVLLPALAAGPGRAGPRVRGHRPAVREPRAGHSRPPTRQATHRALRQALAADQRRGARRRARRERQHFVVTAGHRRPHGLREDQRPRARRRRLRFGGSARVPQPAVLPGRPARHLRR